MEKQKGNAQIISILLMVLLILTVIFVLYRWQQRQNLQKLKATFVQTTKQLESFNYSVSHELMHPIIQMRNTLEAMSINPKKAQIENIRQSLTHMNGLVQLMLQLSKVENEPLHYGTANTQLIVEDVVEGIGLPPQIAVKYESLPTVRADVFLLRQVFLNLIQNAIKFSHGQPQPLIEIQARCNQGWCIFGITDNGIGFAPAEATGLFQLFHRLQPSSQVGGFGVGLVIVKTIVEKHGGRVWAEGATGQGATFWFELPQ